MKRILCISFICTFFLIVYSPSNSFADDTDDRNEIDITLSPNDVLFDVQNMKPGDWAPRVLTITNSGQLDVEYQMNIMNDGEDKLFNEFLLEVEDGNGNIVYNGKLTDFAAFPKKRFLGVNNSEDLTLTIRFPSQLGNEFQGIGVSFKIVIIAEQYIRNTDPEDPDDKENPGDEDPDNPETPTNPGNPGKPDDPGESEDPNDTDNPDDSDEQTEDSGEDDTSPIEELPEDKENETETSGETKDKDTETKNVSKDTDKKGNNKGSTKKDIESVSGIVNNGDSSGGNQLPITAVNMFNYLFIGSYLVLAGGIIYMISRRKSRVSKV